MRADRRESWGYKDRCGQRETDRGREIEGDRTGQRQKETDRGRQIEEDRQRATD